MDKKEHVSGDQSRGGPDFNGKEIRGPEHLFMAADKLGPGSLALSFRGNSQAVPAQDVSHRLIAELVAQIGQRSDNAIITPPRVVLGKLYDQFFQLCRHGRATDGLGAPS